MKVKGIARQQIYVQTTEVKARMDFFHLSSSGSYTCFCIKVPGLTAESLCKVERRCTIELQKGLL